MIKAVVFDFGGVILRTVDHGPRRAWDERLGLPPGTIEELFFNSKRGRRAQLGHTSEPNHWRWVGQQLRLDATDLAQLEVDFWAGDRLNEPVVALIRQLLPSYQVALLSNAMSGLRHSLARDYDIAHLFAPIVISSEVRLMKPDAAIYRLLLRQLNCRPAEAVFIDDMPANIDGARAIGLAAIHYRPDVDLRKELAALEVKTPQSAASNNGPSSRR